MTKTISKNLADIIISFTCIGIGLWFLYEAYKLPPSSSPADMGPGAFPLLISVLLIICGVWMIGNSIIHRNNTEKVTFYKINNTFIFTIILVGYLLLTNIIGYYLTTIIMIPLLLVSSGIRNIKSILLILVIFLLIAFIGFDMLLGVPLP